MASGSGVKKGDLRWGKRYRVAVEKFALMCLGGRKDDELTFLGIESGLYLFENGRSKEGIYLPEEYLTYLELAVS